MKKSFSVSLSNELYVNALMNKLKFVEVDRVASGGMHSDEILIITYEGRLEDYKESDYVQLPQLKNGQSIFHSIRYPNGYLCKSVDEFKKVHEDSAIKFEVKSF